MADRCVALAGLSDPTPGIPSSSTMTGLIGYEAAEGLAHLTVLRLTIILRAVQLP